MNYLKQQETCLPTEQFHAMAPKQNKKSLQSDTKKRKNRETGGLYKKQEQNDTAALQHGQEQSLSSCGHC